MQSPHHSRQYRPPASGRHARPATALTALVLALTAAAFPLFSDTPPAEAQPPALPEEVPPPTLLEDAWVVPRTAAKEPATVIESDELEMIATDDEARFIFTANVRVTGNNILITCDRLEVLSSRDQEDGQGDTVGDVGRISNIIATGNVRITQEGREGTSERAEVLPREGRVILTGSPVIRDDQGEVSGERIILYQGLQRAIVESGPERPARVTLPTLPDMGFRRNDDNQEPEADSE